ncbi:BCLAF1 and THRAP3 family member 3-like isoform X2 [Archocentrus centrarchus]|uniref:BCLAF1 and THRAP3 family member 3-like isoform X2 n=1 Tax=Archocentrus centrarchus TaxID=63155 RepID=UPI0011EA385B|nr:BCLAF1 and THRAP3 family member 3-like isoform X2 [Archocentrus centrarchus]
MSIPRSRSPHYRRLPWEEPGFDPHRVIADMDRRDRLREGSGEIRENFREDMYPEEQRRSPLFTGDRRFGRQPYPDREEFHHRRLSPSHDLRYEDRSLSPLRDGGFDGDRRRGGFREDSQRFENKGPLPQSSLSFTRERLPPTQRSHSDQKESGMGWRREEQGRDRARFRDLSPSLKSDDPRAGGDRERGRRSTQGPNRGRQRENPHHERGLPFKRQRREMDVASHLGYRNEEDFGKQGYSMEAPTDGFGGGTRGDQPLGDSWHSGPLVIEHDHGRELPQWERFAECRELDPEFDRQRSPRPGGSSQELFRKSGSRLDDREEPQEHLYQDNLGESNYYETRRSPVPQDKPSVARYGNQSGPVNHRGRGGTHPAKRRYNPSQRGRPGKPRNHPRLQQASQGYQDLPQEEQRQGYRRFREDYEDVIEDDPSLAEKGKLQQWEQAQPRSLERPLGRDDLDPKMPRQRQRGWSDQKTNNMTVLTEETLTIKVDMSRPVNQSSQLCYSSDRQLSLDLVNVGRQRLDFLPMLEHSGTYRETAMHTGTFAQEIITLVHLVKEQYFRGDGVTLNERFSAPQKGGYSEDEMEELTLDDGFDTDRGFSLDMDSLLNDDKPLFSRLGPTQGLRQQPVRGPGDLRHDLERRRQEKLEGVKVTIPGNTMTQHHLGPVSDPDVVYTGKMSQMDQRRREGNMGPRRGALSRVNTGAQRRNNRFDNRKQNFRNGSAGPNW